MLPVDGKSAIGLKCHTGLDKVDGANPPISALQQFFSAARGRSSATETLRNWGDRKSNPIIYGLLDCALDCRRAVPSRRQTTVTLLDEWKDSVDSSCPR